MPERDWPSWEEWTIGWQVIDNRLHLEGEDVDSLLPPHLPAEANPFRPSGLVPRGPWVHEGQDGPHDWVLRFPHENGWESIVYAEFGVALNPAGMAAVNRRVFGNEALWVPYPQNGEDPGLVWPLDEWEAAPTTAHLTDDELSILSYSELISTQMLDDPDQLLTYMKVAASLPSDPDVRRRERAEGVRR